ncbi:MAG: type II toxin-antitoxin system HicA family toxin [Candidatus Thermoplasmatota archaeon]|nr:type II toxin-antitoxin system HicA family toxin [Candidatus Thermoplasmatota archaeon]
MGQNNINEYGTNFVLDRQKGSHKIFYHPKKKIRVVVPCHKRDLPKGTQKEILKQAKIDPDELR